MANKEYQWDVYLKPNYLTQDDLNDCVADVLTRLQTQHNEEIAAKILNAKNFETGEINEINIEVISNPEDFWAD